MLLIFDLDGTLIDTREEIFSTFRKAFSNLGIHLNEEKLERNIGYPLEELITRLLGYYEIQVAQEIKKLYNQMKNRKIRVFPGMVEVLQVLDIPKSVLTSKKKYMALRDLRYTGILDYFSIILGADEIEKRKPHPDGIIKIMQLAKEKDAVLIGDTELDILAAKNAGIKSIAVTWGFRTEDFLRNFRPDSIAREPRDIVRILEHLI